MDAPRFRSPIGIGMEKKLNRIEEVSSSLSAEFQRVVPLHPGKKQRDKKNFSEKESAASIETGLKQFYAFALAERQRHRLGVIARARVAFNLQQSLLQAGYSAELVKQVLFAMLTSAFIGGK
jgi:hypothetical protein